MAPMALAWSWENLPADVISQIACRLPCSTDRANMAKMCRSWREGARLHPLPLELPWLLLPSLGAPSLCCLTCGDGAGSVVHRLRAPTDVQRARFFGSYDGRWVFLAANGDRDNRIVDIISGKVYSIPDQVFLEHNGGTTASDMTYLVATLSSSPDDERCIGAALVHHHGTPNLVFWIMGEDHATDPSWQAALHPSYKIEDMIEESYSMRMEDVIYHDGSFYCLTPGCRIDVWKVEFNPDGSLKLQQNWTSIRITSSLGHISQGTGGRYLVESRGELLLVERNARNFFKVFSGLETKKKISKNADCVLNWLDDLDGRILFVGRGSSRSYELALYPVFESGVYFLDDSNFHDVNRRPFTGSDNGKWLEGPSHMVNLERCFPMKGPSNESRPAWILP